MAQNRYYSSNAVKATLVGGITNSAVSLVVDSVSGFPGSFPYTLILERDEALEEIVTVTAASGTTLTVTRGSDGTTAVAHSTGVSVEHGVSARDFTEPQAHIAASSGVHGLTGSVVGTSDTQTLTNKTLTSPTITGATATGGWTATNPTTGTTVLTTATGSSNGLLVQPGAATALGLTVQGLASQSAALVRAKLGSSQTGRFVEYLDQSNVTVFAIEADGTIDGTLKGATLDSTSTIDGVSGLQISTDHTALADMQSAWTAWTPTFTNVTSGGGDFHYRLVGKTLHLRGHITAGTATALGLISVSLPASLTAASAPAGTKQYMVGSAGGSALWSVAEGASVATSAGSFNAGSSVVGAAFTGVIEVA